MINQGIYTGAVSSLAPNSAEVVHTSQGHAYMSSATGSEATPWAMHKSDNSSLGNEIPAGPRYHYDQRTDQNSTIFRDGSIVTTVAGASSNLGEAAVPQEYNGYASYNGTVPYVYENAGYPGYYNYAQSSNHSYPLPLGAYQNTGAPYQPISSFQNTGSYVVPASYSSTYYNPADYQTSGVYQSSGAYSDQTTTWSEHCTSYTPYQYTNCTPDSNGAYTSNSTTATSQQYREDYKHWSDYYSQTEVSCAPGTENLSVTSAPALPFSVPTVTGVNLPSSTQQPQPHNSPWKPDSVSSQFTSLQGDTVTSGVYNDYNNRKVIGFPNNYASHLPSHSQSSLDSKLTFDSFQDQQMTACHQTSISQGAATHQATQDYQFPLHTPLDTQRVSTLQIPTNPRIASNLPSGLPKFDKGGGVSMSSSAKPAYISVSLPKANDNALYHDATGSTFKPAVFPPSLRGYVERALARCKDDVQMTACQTIMKEIITTATANGTLCTLDWDTEPLFPLPNSNKFNGMCSSPVSSLLKCKRSPRRTKSRWEPLVDEKITERATVINCDTVNYDTSAHYNGVIRKFSVRNSDTKDFASNNTKLIPSEQSTANKNIEGPEKKPRVGANVNGVVDASSDSDMEQNLITHCSAATAFADSPEERKKRKSRSKRFEKGRGSRGRWEPQNKPKNAGAGELYARRACASALNTSLENGSGRAVEDIDWDSLTVKGVSQEIEKCYLRLTSAPDPSTVRPEEVLEKALQMVQTSQKNYLYKCDQLKSIRQDLTVQRINNELTVKVYESHARLALEVGDLPEYNQCQSQLKALYADGIKGCHLEFYAYNLLRVIMHSTNNRDVLSSMSRLSEEAKKDPGVKHALAVRAAFTAGNYVKFFRLYKTAPNLNACLMDLYVEKMRYSAVKCMCRSYRPTVPVAYIAQSLGFRSSSCEEDDGLGECSEWLKLHGACLITQSQNLAETQLDTKASCSSLYMPEAEDATGHGDANLAVNDFLTRTS